MRVDDGLACGAKGGVTEIGHWGVVLDTWM